MKINLDHEVWKNHCMVFQEAVWKPLRVGFEKAGEALENCTAQQHKEPLQWKMKT